jgi:hypothetical protein
LQADQVFALGTLNDEGILEILYDSNRNVQERARSMTVVPTKLAASGTIRTGLEQAKISADVFEGKGS